MKRLTYIFPRVTLQNELDFLSSVSELGAIVHKRNVSRNFEATNPASQREWINFCLIVNSEAAPAVVQLIRRYDLFLTSGEQLFYREECEFTKDELDQAELLTATVNRSPLDFLTPTEGMIYDYSIKPSLDSPAPWCWQITPRLMRLKNIPHASIGIHCTIPMEILVHHRLLNSVHGLRYKYISLGPVFASNAPSEWHQIMSKRVMPPYHTDTTGVLGPRSTEHPPDSSPPNVYDNPHVGYMPIYSRADVVGRFGSIPEMTFTHELYGCWGPGNLANQVAPPQPRLVVSQQTRQNIINAGVKRIRYVPVRLVE